MPAPTNADELLDLIQKSGVVDDVKLRTYIQKFTDPTGLPKDPAKLAGHLVRDAILTYFQAEQLLQGKYKRFSIGKYKVLEKLGAGGMAQVFLCEHKLMRRRVAIKVLPTAKANDPSSLARFYREARAVAAVDHPNIVRAYDIDQDENLHFLVMEYVDGTNLQDLIKKFGPLDIVRACHYIYGSAVGLQHAHEMGLIHRDIKPGNILIDRSGVVKVLDMGLARFFHDDDDALTKKYDENVLGTADYLAPEQALDSHTVDIRADIYSLGATFYFLLTASALFPEGSVAQKLIWHQNRLPRPIRSLRPEVPEEIAAIVERMMAKDTAKRYQTPSELIAALAPWVTSPIPPPSDREMPQISPAAGGSGNRGPATIVGPLPGVSPRGVGTGTPDAPTVIASVTTTPSQQIPLIPATTGNLNPGTSSQAEISTTTATPNPAVWETLDTDTQTVSKEDTDRTVHQSEPAARTRKQAAPQPPSHGPLLFVCLGLIVLTMTATGVYLAFIRKPHTPEPPPPSVSHKFTVSSAGGEFTFPTLRAALSKVGPGDTIVIAEAKLTEPGLKLDKNRHKDVTIESANPDKPAIIEAGGGTVVMFDATDTEGFRLKNIEFDGKGTASVGVQISGLCPAAMIENVSVRSVKTAGFRVLNAAGDATRPIVFDKVRAYSTPGDGILLYATHNVDNKRIVIRNSRFEGRNDKEGVGVRLDGPALDLEIRGNRFFNLSSAVSFGRPPKDKIIRAHLTANTVFQTSAGLLLELTPPPPLVPNEPPPPAGQFELAILQNYFAKTAEIGKVNGANGPIPGVTATDNVFGPDCVGGNLGIPLTALPSPLLASTNPADDDAKFLRFPGGQPEFNKVKVGAP